MRRKEFWRNLLPLSAAVVLHSRKYVRGRSGVVASMDPRLVYFPPAHCFVLEHGLREDGPDSGRSQEALVRMLAGTSTAVNVC